MGILLNKANEIYSIISDIKTTVAEKGISMSDTPFEDYPQSIQNISIKTAEDVNNDIKALVDDTTDRVSIEIPKNITTLRNGICFMNNTIVFVNIPNNITKINSNAFFNCQKLMFVIIPNSVLEIESSAFTVCSNLSILCEAESKPEGWADDWKDSNASVTWGVKINYSDDYIYMTTSGVNVILKYIGLSDNVIFPETIQGTPNGGFLSAFENNSYVKHIEIPSTISTLMENSFYNCSNLEYISLPDSLEYVGKNFIGKCNKLSYLKAPANALTYVENLPNLSYIKITGDANSKIPDNTLNNLSELSVIELSPAIISFGNNILNNNSKLQKIILNDNTSVGDNFLNNSTIEYLSIPKNIKFSNNFLLDANVKTLYFNGSLKDYLALSLTNKINYTYLYIDNYLYSSKEFLFLSNGITKIGSYTLANNNNILNIKLDNSVITIENNAFESCTKLKSIVIPSSVTTIGENAFKNCPNLTIYCEAQSKPSGWSETWNSDNLPVIWNYNN